MNIRTLATVLATSAAACANAAYYTLKADTQAPGQQIVLDRVFTGNTPLFKVLFYEAGDTMSVTNWTMMFRYSYGKFDTNGMATIVGSNANNTVITGDTTNTAHNAATFKGTSFFEPGEYYFSVYGTNTDGSTKTFATGTMIEDYDPAAGTSVTVLTSRPVNWDTVTSSGVLRGITLSNATFQGDTGFATHAEVGVTNATAMSAIASTGTAAAALSVSVSGTVHSALISSNSVAMGASAATGTQARAQLLTTSNGLSDRIADPYWIKYQMHATGGVAVGTGYCSTTNRLIILQPGNGISPFDFNAGGANGAGWYDISSSSTYEAMYSLGGTNWYRTRNTDMDPWGDWTENSTANVTAGSFPMKAGERAPLENVTWSAQWDLGGAYHGPGTYLTGTASGFTAGTATVAQAALTIPLSGVANAGTAAASNSAAFIGSASGIGTNTYLYGISRGDDLRLAGVGGIMLRATNSDASSYSAFSAINNIGRSMAQIARGTTASGTLFDYTNADSGQLYWTGAGPFSIGSYGNHPAVMGVNNKAQQVWNDGITTNLGHVVVASNLTVSGSVSAGNGWDKTNFKDGIANFYNPGKYVTVDSDTTADWGFAIRGANGNVFTNVVHIKANGGTGRISFGSPYPSYFPVIESGGRDALAFDTAARATFASNLTVSGTIFEPNRWRDLGVTFRLVSGVVAPAIVPGGYGTAYPFLTNNYCNADWMMPHDDVATGAQVRTTWAVLSTAATRSLGVQIYGAVSNASQLVTSNLNPTNATVLHSNGWGILLHTQLVQYAASMYPNRINIGFYSAGADMPSSNMLIRAEVRMLYP